MFHQSTMKSHEYRAHTTHLAPDQSPLVFPCVETNTATRLAIPLMASIPVRTARLDDRGTQANTSVVWYSRCDPVGRCTVAGVLRYSASVLQPGTETWAALKSTTSAWHSADRGLSLIRYICCVAVGQRGWRWCFLSCCGWGRGVRYAFPAQSWDRQIGVLLCGLWRGLLVSGVLECVHGSIGVLRRTMHEPTTIPTVVKPQVGGVHSSVLPGP